MAKINWYAFIKFYSKQDNLGKEEVIDQDKVAKFIHGCEAEGFKYNYSDSKVRTPSGRFLTASDIEYFLNNLSIANKDQMESLRAAEYLIAKKICY